MKDALKNSYEHRSRIFSDIPNWKIFNLVRIMCGDDEYVFDFSVFDKYIGIIREACHGQFRIICCGFGFEKDGNKKREFPFCLNVNVYNHDGSLNPGKSLSNIPMDNPGFSDFLTLFMKAMENHLKENSCLENIYFKVCDEPQGERWKKTCNILEIIKKAAPSIRIDHTAGSIKEYNNPSVNLLLTSHFLAEPDSLQRLGGQELWSYNNYFTMIDTPNIHFRVIGWTHYLYDLKGYHHWAWGRDFFADPNAQLNSAEPAPPGYHFLVYLDKKHKKIIDSIRWEMLRETAEDYEILLLAESNGLAGKIFCRHFIKAGNDYNTDPDDLFHTRHELLVELEKIADQGGLRPQPVTTELRTR